MTALAPDVPFAEHPADAVAEQYLQWPELLQEVLAELSSRRASDVLSDAALGALVGGLDVRLRRASTKAPAAERGQGGGAPTRRPPAAARALRADLHRPSLPLAHRLALAAILREDVTALEAGR